MRYLLPSRRLLAMAVTGSICAAMTSSIVQLAPALASAYTTAVTADSPSDYWPTDDGSGTSVQEFPAVGARSLSFNGPLNWYGSGLVTGSNSAIQGPCGVCAAGWLSGVPAALPASRSAEIWFLSLSGSVVSPQGLISVRQPQNGSGGCSEGHTDVVLEPNPAIRVDSLDCNIAEFATDCHFGQNGVPNILDGFPHLIDVTENSGVTTIFIDAVLCATGGSVNTAISSPDCVALGSIECGSPAFPIAQTTVIGQAALYPSTLSQAQITNHLNAGHAVVAPRAIYVQPVSTLSGHAFSGLVAVFTDPSPSTNPADYTSIIDWGDGGQDAGTIAVSGIGGTISGTHTYVTAGFYTITVALSRSGSASIVGTNLARVITHYQVWIQGWIPQPFVVDPVLPIEGIPYFSPPALIDGNCLSIPNAAQAINTTVTTLFSGDSHAALPGTYRVIGALDFDWDGNTIKNAVPKRDDGFSHKVKLYWIVNHAGRCQVTAREASDDTTAEVTGPNTFAISIGFIAGKVPFLPHAIAPSIRNTVVGSVAPDGSLTLNYTTSGFPSLGYKVSRNGVLVDTNIENDVSCLSNSAVRGVGGAALLAAGLNALSNFGMETISANASGLNSTHLGMTCALNIFVNPFASATMSGSAALVAPAAQASSSAQTTVPRSAGSTAGSTASPANSTTGIISGRVTDTTTGRGLQNMCVRATGLLGPSPITLTLTNEKGAYALPGLSPGTYDVAFQECGGGAHVTSWYNGKSVQQNADSVTVNAGATTGSINALLGTGSAISGTIRNQAGQPLAGICAHAEDASGHFADALPSISSGAYHVGGLRTGSYKLTFFDCSLGDYLVNTSLPAVTVGSTGLVTNVDASMTLGGRVTGNVSGPDGKPLPGVCPVALTTGSVEAGTGVSDLSGNYVIHALAAGNYIVRFADCLGSAHAPLFWNNKTSSTTADVVTVALGAASTGISASMMAGGTIVGTIRDASGSPLAGACAVAVSTQPGASGGQSASTDSSGAYSISGLAAGAYVVEMLDCSGGNHQPQWFNGKADAASADPVSVTAGVATSGISGNLPTGAAFTGHVTSGGSPLANVCVTAYDVNQNPVASASTDSAGSYTVAGIADGAYKVEFSDCIFNAHPTQWYATKVDFATATPVQITLGSTTPGIDAALLAPGAIAGTITNPAGQGLTGICVRVQPTGTGISGFATTDASGAYTVSGLTPGSYIVGFTDCMQQQYIPQWFGAGSPDQTTAQVLNVFSGSTTSSINAVLTTGGSLSGTVTDAAGAPLANACVSAVPQTIGAGSPLPVLTDTFGHYTLSMLETGTYIVQFVDCASGGRLTTTSGPEQMTAPSAISNVNAQLLAGGAIAGTVSDAVTTAVLVGICVDVYSANSGLPVAQAVTQADGSYTVRQLPAGTYKVRFSDCTAGSHAAQWATNAPDPASANAVAVAAGASIAGINAALQPLASISIANVTVNRPVSGNATATFTISLAAPSASPVSVDVTTADGTALAQNADYVPIPVTTVAFAPGQTTKTASVTIPGFPGHGTNLTFTLNLSQPMNASIATTSATCTIISP